MCNTLIESKHFLRNDSYDLSIVKITYFRTCFLKIIPHIHVEITVVEK